MTASTNIYVRSSPLVSKWSLDERPECNLYYLLTCRWHRMLWLIYTRSQNIIPHLCEEATTQGQGRERVLGAHPPGYDIERALPLAVELLAAAFLDVMRRPLEGE